MKKFYFRLERLLRLKHSERRQRVTMLADRKRRLEECEQALTGAHRHFDHLQDSYRFQAKLPTSPGMLMMAQYAMAAAERLIARRADAVRVATADVEQARERLLEKSREVDILERMRRRRWEEHTLNENRRDQGRIDATAVQQYALRSLSSSN